MKKAAFLTAGGGLAGAIPASIQRALAINPEAGSTYLDAEHIVILMQENRSFDHCYGTLRGVRGFNDPRAIALPNGNPVWFQSNAAGETYAPFRLNIKDTKATWMGYLPHTWVDQSLARNDGWHDRWLPHKAAKNYAQYPLTLGYYNREDIPFYYAFADAFTICDQNFCSSLTGTTPNRLHLWSGTLREKPSIQSKACVSNEDADYGTAVSWKTFPERLEEAGVSWCIYQNELSIATGLSTDAERWLANFGDNPLEYFAQYGVRFSQRHRRYLEELVKTLPDEIAKLEAAPEPQSDAVKKNIRTMRVRLDNAHRSLEQYTEENFAKLSEAQRNIHRKAFVTNESDPHFRELVTLSYEENGKERRMQVPKGDVFYQFRQDVQQGKLPMVSWLVAPQYFSDHPDSPWYGAWYVSEALNVLTQNPEVWKKTIFILCYDENDGYFDHVPPFVPPAHDRPDSGKASDGIDPSVEHVREPRRHSGPIGLGYRVPLVIASPWSRGGYVCSQVFDHTSILQLLENVLSHKTGKPIRETNISEWRRTVCGDLSSVFRPYLGEKIDLPQPVKREAFLQSIHQAQFKPVSDGFKKLEPADIEFAQRSPDQCEWLPRQEPGVRPACPLPYELSVDGALNADRRSFAMNIAALRELFAEKATGAPFLVYDMASAQNGDPSPVRSYAVKAGDRLADVWALRDAAYHLRVYGPNGFYREFRGTADDPSVDIALEPTRSGSAIVRLANRDANRTFTIHIEDASYGAQPQKVQLGSEGSEASRAEVAIDLGQTHGWHDLRIRIEEAPHFAKRYAGRMETGRESVTDPLMARVRKA
ncbi:phosphocholine-specific phospholipase C [Verrucomicrobiota bacterium sgz303538]